MPLTLALDLTVTSDILLRGLQQVGRAVTNTTQLALSCIKLSTDDGQLRLVGISQEHAITTWCGAEVRSAGSLLVPAVKFIELITKCPHGATLGLSTVAGGQKLMVRGPGFNIEINGLPVADFPAIPETDISEALVLPAGTLNEMLQQVQPAAAFKDERILLTGVHMLVQNNIFTLEATSGFAAHRVQYPFVTPKTVDLVVHGRACLDALALLDATQPVSLVFPEKDGRIARVVFVQDTLQLLANTIEGNYPNISPQMQGKAQPITATLSPDLLLAALARAKQMADDTPVNIQLKPGSQTAPGALIIRATSPESGRHIESLAATVSGPMEIAVNPKYLQALLVAHKVATGGHSPAVLHMNTAKDPILLKHNQFVGVMMPMHLAKPTAAK